MNTHIKHWPIWLGGIALLCAIFLVYGVETYKDTFDATITYSNAQGAGQVNGARTWRNQFYDFVKNKFNPMSSSAKQPAPISPTSPSTEPSSPPAAQTPTSPSVPATNPYPTPYPSPYPTPQTTPTYATPYPTPYATPAYPTPAYVTPYATPYSSPYATPQTSTSSAKWGAFVGYSSSSVSSFETLVGHTTNIVAIFTGWGGDGAFPSEFKSFVGDKNKTLLIFWEPYGTTLDSINSGESDAYIQQFAAAAKSYGGPVILAPFHEMNGNWDPWGGTVGNNTPAKVIAAWKRVHGFFGQATNVKFGWAPNNLSVPNTAANSIASYYPGDAFVDYVGIDGFNFGNPWQTFSQVFNSALTQVKTYNKPIYLFSMASAAGSNKDTWVTDFLSVQLPAHPEIKGWVWFNENKEQDWRVNSDNDTLNAFKVLLP